MALRGLIPKVPSTVVACVERARPPLVAAPQATTSPEWPGFYSLVDAETALVELLLKAVRTLGRTPNWGQDEDANQ